MTTTAPHHEHVQTLIDMAGKRFLAVMYYRKGATSNGLKPRLVEPYSFADGQQDLMIRAYQLEHGGNSEEYGWRFFMAHKIDKVEPTRLPFKARRAISLPKGVIAEASRPTVHWKHDGRRAYRDAVSNALADGTIDAGERFDIEKTRQEYDLAPDDVRFVHASLYHRCLGAVLDDGFMSEAEIEQIDFLHRAMRSLGWFVGDVTPAGQSL